MPVNEDATRGSLKMNCRLTAPFSKQDHSEFEKEAYRVLRTQPAHHAVAGPPGTAPPVLTQQPVPSVSDLLNEHRTELGQYNDVKNLLKIRKVYSQEAHTPCPEAIVERYNAAVASIYENPLHAIGQIEWQNEEGDVQLDIDNPVDISIAQLEHEGFTEELLADHATAIQVRKQDIVAVEKANKVNDVAAQTNARMVKCVLDHVCSEIRGDISHFSLFQESINFLHTKAAGLSDHDQRGIYERHFLALEANVKAGKFSVAAVKEIRKRYLETFGEEAIAGTSEYTTFAHRIVALLTTAIGNERSTSYQIVQNYLVNLAGKEQTLEWPVLVAHLERCENAIAAKKRGADPLESQSLKVNRVGADDQALPHAPECNNTRCSTCAWHGPESKHNTCTCHHLPKCGRWDGKSSRDAHFKYHKDCSANPAATKGKQPARSNNTAATNHANGQQVVLSRRDLNKLIRSVKSQAGCRPNEDQPNNNHDQPGPSSRGGKRGGPRVSALRSRMAQGNSGSSSTSTSGDVEMGEGSTADQPETLDVTDAEVIGLQDGHFVGDSGAMEHIHDAGGHANQVTRLIDANFAMGNRRNSMWYSDTYGPDAQWDEIFRVVKVSQLSMFQDHDLVDYEVLRSNNVVISAIKRTGSGEIKTGLCQIEAMDRDYVSKLRNTLIANAKSRKPHKHKPNSTKQELSNLQYLHEVLAHASYRSLGDSVRNNMIIGVEVEWNAKNSNKPILETCVHCASGKITRNPVYESKVRGPNGEEYGQAIIDDFTRKSTINFLKTKSFEEVSSRLLETTAEWERDLGLQVHEYYSDGGTELGDKFRALLRKKFANRVHVPTFRQSPPYEKERNGVVESFIKGMKAGTLTMLLRARLPPLLTKFACSEYSRIKNKLVHPEAGDPTDGRLVSPDFLWTQTAYDVSKEYPFGCQVTIFIDPDERGGTWGLRGNPGVYLGRSGHTLVQVYNLKTRRVQLSGNVIVHRDRFPGLTKDLKMLYDPYSPYSPEEVSIPKFDVEAYWTDPSKHELPEPDRAFTGDVLADNEVTNDDTSSDEPRYGLRPRKAISYNESSRWKFVSDTPLATPVPEPSKELPPSSTENNDQHVHIDDAIEEVVQHFPEVFDPVPAALNPEKVIISETDSDIDSDLDDSIYDGMEEVSASPRIPINRAQSKREDGEEKLDDGEADLNAILNAYGIKTEIRSKIVTECEKVKPFMKAMSRKLEKRLNRKITNECLSTEAENEMTPTLKVVPKPDIPKIRIADMPPPPRSYREAMAGPWKEYWEHADAEELNSHVSKKTYRYSRYPSHGRVLRSHIVRSYKGTVDGYLDRFKSRDVLAGHP